MSYNNFYGFLLDPLREVGINHRGPIKNAWSEIPKQAEPLKLPYLKTYTLVEKFKARDDVVKLPKLVTQTLTSLPPIGI